MARPPRQPHREPISGPWRHSSYRLGASSQGPGCAPPSRSPSVHTAPTVPALEAIDPSEEAASVPCPTSPSPWSWAPQPQQVRLPKVT